jgi:hypothetical protein
MVATVPVSYHWLYLWKNIIWERTGDRMLVSGWCCLGLMGFRITRRTSQVMSKEASCLWLLLWVWWTCRQGWKESSMGRRLVSLNVGTKLPGTAWWPWTQRGELTHLESPCVAPNNLDYTGIPFNWETTYCIKCFYWLVDIDTTR